MTRRKRTSMIVLLAVVALLIIAGVAWAAGVFPDVLDGGAHTAAIEWAAENDIVQGYGNGYFGPYDNILRGQAATMFKNYDAYLKSTAEGTSTCSDCHNDTTLLTGKATAWGMSLHGTGTAFDYAGGRAACAGCHSGGAFSAMVAAGQNPDEVTAGDPNPTRQDCRACHEIHVTFTGADWALETTAPVEFYAIPGTTFDGGAGNLCATCHQPRGAFPAAVDGMVKVTSTRFGPHHGPQSAILRGTGGATTGTPMVHYTMVSDTCVTCHMGSGANHTFNPNIATCKTCHGTATNFNIGDTQTEVQALLDALEAKLLAANMLTADGYAVVGTYTAAKAGALWNWRTISIEDKSLGVHNPAYTKALLNAGLAAFAG